MSGEIERLGLSVGRSGPARLIVAVAPVVLSLVLGAFSARAETYTVRVTTPDGQPVAGITLDGTNGFTQGVTDAQGELDFELSSTTSAPSIVPSADALYVFTPFSLVATRATCPNKVCGIVADINGAAQDRTTAVVVNFRTSTSRPVSGVPVIVSNSARPCEEYRSDNQGRVVAAVYRTEQCDDSDVSTTNNHTLLIPRSPELINYTFQGATRRVCSTKRLSATFVVSGGSVSPLPPSVTRLYFLQALSITGVPVAGVEFVGEPFSSLPRERRITNATGRTQGFTLRDLSLPADAVMTVYPVGDLTVYPRMLTINFSRLGSVNIGPFVAHSNQQGSRLMTVRVVSSEGPRPGVSIESDLLTACPGESAVTGANGTALLPYHERDGCDPFNSSKRDDPAQVRPSAQGCQFTDLRNPPFARCIDQNAASADFTAFCGGAPPPNQLIVSGIVRDRKNEAIFGANIIVDGAQAATTGGDGRYSFFVSTGSSPTVQALHGTGAFNPQEATIRHIDRNLELDFFQAGPLDNPAATPTPGACPPAAHYTLGGRVVNRAGSGVENVLIRDQGDTVVATTGRDGSYSFVAPAGEDLFVTAEARDPFGTELYLSPGGHSLRVRCDRANLHFTVTEAPAFTIAGQVRDRVQQPISGARVTLTHGTTVNELETGSDGFFSFDVPDEVNYTITAQHPIHPFSPPLHAGEAQRDVLNLLFVSLLEPTATPTPPPGGGSPSPTAVPTSPPVNPTAPPPTNTPRPPATATPLPPPPTATPVPPTSTPVPPPPTSTPTRTPTAAPTAPAPTQTPTPTPTATRTPRPEPSPTSTPVPPTATPTRTATPWPSPTEFPTVAPTAPPTAPPTEPPSPGLSVAAQSVCATAGALRFEVNVSSEAPVTLAYDLYPTAAAGTFEAPPGRSFLETVRPLGVFLTLRLFYGSQMVAVAPVSFAECPPTPTPTPTASPTATATPIPSEPPPTLPPPTQPPAESPTLTPSPPPGETAPPISPTLSPLPTTPPVETVPPPTPTEVPTATPTPIVYGELVVELRDLRGKRFTETSLKRFLTVLGGETINLRARNRRTAEESTIQLAPPFTGQTITLPIGSYRFWLEGVTTTSTPRRPNRRLAVNVIRRIVFAVRP